MITFLKNHQVSFLMVTAIGINYLKQQKVLRFVHKIINSCLELKR